MTWLTRKITKIGGIIKHRDRFRRLIHSYLFFLDHPEKFWGSITADDEAGIRYAVDHARQFDGPIVEIGCLFGHTTNLIASLKEPDTPLIAVENFSWNPFYIPADEHRRFLKRTIRYAMDHCATEIFDGSARTFYDTHTTVKPSMVFIDAKHDYESVKADIAWAVSNGCPVISGHDYIDVHPGVVQAVDEAFGNDVSIHGSVWVHSSKPTASTDNG